jgi:enamine deaminase RidA (YjgF/YER057c/UK114 family)
MTPCESLLIPDQVPVPLGNYVAVTHAGGLGFVSGQFPMRQGRLAWTGRVGETLSVSQGRQAAVMAALNALGQIRKACAHAWPRVRLLRLDGYVASAPGFTDQAGVLDGASDVLVELLCERGRHARTAFAVPQLPGDSPIELVLTFFVDP